MNRQFEGFLSRPAHVLTWMMLRTGLLRAVMRSFGKSRRMMESSVRNIIRNPSQRTSDLLNAIMTEAESGASFVPFEEWQRDQFLWNRLKTNYAHHLGALAMPTLIVHGDRDNGVPVAYAKNAAKRIPYARLHIVRDGGHWVQRDRPEVVASALIDFLEELA